MATLYVLSTETYSGKTAVVIGLGLRMRNDGFSVGYMKPVNTNAVLPVSYTHLASLIRSTQRLAR